MSKLGLSLRNNKDISEINKFRIVTKRVYAFMWKGKRDKVKRKSEGGGLKLPDLDSKIKAIQVM